MKEMRIAKIISTKQIVINAGQEDGIKKGDTLEIIDKFGSDPVIDPDTGESLGCLDISKGTVTVSQVYPHMAIAEAPYKTTNMYNALNPSERLIDALSGNIHIQSDLNVDPKEITGGLPQASNTPIKVGDIVIKR